MDESCVVCACSNASYKCPTCRAKYCSAKCCRLHKQDQCVPLLKPENSLLRSSASTDTNRESNDKKILSEEQKKKMSSNISLTTLLKSRRLQDTITAIDGSEDRLGELKRARGNNDFEDVVCLILNIIKE